MPLPVALLDSLEGTPGFDRQAFEAVHAAGEAVTSLRVNPAKLTAAEAGRLLFPALVTGGVPWCEEGYYLRSRPSFTLDPLLHAGAYYVQEASSMFVAHALRQTADLSRPLAVLDLCAAPGGKSTLLSACLPDESVLVANEVIRSRVPALSENLTKWGSPHVIVSRSDPRDFSRPDPLFDVMLVDAPCSGSGLFRRDPSAIGEWSPQLVSLCSQRQRRILSDALPALKKEGILLYATCSYSPEENEAVADWLVEEHGLEAVPVTVPPGWPVVPGSSPRHGVPAYRFYPYKAQGEGFFLCCLRKKSGRDCGARRPVKNNPAVLSRKASEDAGRWLKKDRPLTFITQHEEVWALPPAVFAAWQSLSPFLQVKQAGVRMGKSMQGTLVPDHALALSTIIDPALPSLALTKEEAIRYLRKETLSREDVAKGWLTVQYETLNLGWIKKLPGRINNYYPKEWRILQQSPLF